MTSYERFGRGYSATQLGIQCTFHRFDRHIQVQPSQRSDVIKVRLTAQLKDWTGGSSELDLDSPGNLRGVFRELNAAFPGIDQRILDDEGRLRDHVNVFVNSENSRDLDHEETRLRDGDVVVILPSVAGG